MALHRFPAPRRGACQRGPFSFTKENQNYLSENGIEKAIEKYCQLDRSKKEEELLFQLILAQYFEENDADPFDMPYYKKA